MITLLLLILGIYTKDPCVNPRFYWLNNNAFTNNNNWPLLDKNQFVLTENFTQCGVEWFDLYNIDITLIKDEKKIWLLLFQQYCSSSLNIAKLELFINNLTPEQELLNENMINNLKNQIVLLKEYLIKSFNLLDSYCDKMNDLNFLDAKIYTINLLQNLSIINNGILIGYCDNIYYPNNLLLDIYTLFYNTSFHDNSKYNQTEFLTFKPYNITELKDQFINGNWVTNIVFNKQSSLFLFLILMLAIFVIVSQTCWYYGNCIICRQKTQSEVKTIPRCLHPNICYWTIRGCLRLLFCGLCDRVKKKKKNDDDIDINDEDYSINEDAIVLDDLGFENTPNIIKIESNNNKDK